MLKWLKWFGGNEAEKEVKAAQKLVAEINGLEAEFASKSDEELRQQVEEIAGQLRHDDDEPTDNPGLSLDDVLPEMFALTREAAKRALGIRHYDVQLIGGSILHRGRIAEMGTGEGKTLVATLPVALNAIAGRGVHVVTVNDFLARRDAEWMGRVYNLLGLSVGVINHEHQTGFIFEARPNGRTTPYGSGEELRAVPRAESYLADITYGTNNEFGFDYLRDNMVFDLNQRVQRELNFAIVDEVDNILVDEARTPLIISAPAQEATEQYYQIASLVKRLRRDVDYTVEEKTRSVMITEEGIAKIEGWLAIRNLYDPENFQLAHLVEQSLKAHAVFQRDKDYVLLKDGTPIDGWDREAEIVIIDEHTGRMMIGRRYSEGLHQAIEAKENVRIQRESRTMATITFQNYFRMYKKLAGMTGTASTEQEEFHKIYNLDVVPIPTHRPRIRQDFADLVFKSERAKYDAVVDEIIENHKSQRPVLVGTASIEKSEYLSELLKRKGVTHRVLNAKLHELEASVVAQAGRPGAVTIATNMAGRGVDILLGGNPAGLTDEYMRSHKVDPLTATEAEYAEARQWADEQVAKDRGVVLELGGLHIVGTERHEARRIDNQLRGRAGRQGDPGSSRFFVSLEDELMRRFGGQNIVNLMDKFGLEEDVPIESGMVSKAIESAQTKVEGYNFDIRKHVVEYDDVMNKQRTIFYQQRERVLGGIDTREMAQGLLEQELTAAINTLTGGSEFSEEWDVQQIYQAIRQFVPMPPDVNSTHFDGMSRQELLDKALEYAGNAYDTLEKLITPENMRMVERAVLLQCMDQLWIEHLTALDDLREGIGLRAYGQLDPLVAYKREAFLLWDQFLAATQHRVALSILNSVQMTPVGAEAPSGAAAPQPSGNGAARRNGGPPAGVRRGALESARDLNKQAPRDLTYSHGGEDAKPSAKARAATAVKVGRNDPCPCGSGKKYKRCCGANL